MSALIKRIERLEQRERERALPDSVQVLCTTVPAHDGRPDEVVRVAENRELGIPALQRGADETSDEFVARVTGMVEYPAAQGTWVLDFIGAHDETFA